MAPTNNKWKTLILPAAADAVTGLLKIRYIRWEQITTAGDDLILDTTAGVNIVTLTAENATDGIDIPIDETVDGIVVTTMDSGRVIVFLD